MTVFDNYEIFWYKNKKKKEKPFIKYVVLLYFFLTFNFLSKNNYLHLLHNLYITQILKFSNKYREGKENQPS